MLVHEVLALYARHCAVEGVHCEEARIDRERTFRLFTEAHGGLDVSACKPFHLSDWIEAHPTWKSVSTRRAKANEVRAAFQWAAAGERIDRNPFQSVRYAEAERRPDLPDEILDQVASLANKPFEKAVRFLRLTGCRLSELANAVWADVDLERGEWVIPRHKSRRFTGKAKVIALVPEAVGLLLGMAEAEAMRPNALRAATVQAGVADKAGLVGPIFLNNRGQPWNRRTLGQHLRRMKARHGIDTPATLHGIRHRMASEAIASGAPLKLIAEQLGHATTAITEKFYFHRSAEHLEAIRQAAQLGMPKKG